MDYIYVVMVLNKTGTILYRTLIQVYFNFAQKNILNMKKKTNKPVIDVTNAKSKKAPNNLLDAFEKIVELSRDSELGDDFFKAARPEIRFISKKLSLTEMQSVLLSIFIDKSEDSRIRASEIASFLCIGTIRMLKHIDEIEDLVNKRYLKGSNRREDRTYRVPPQVLKAMRLNEPFEYKVDPVKNTQDFFDRFNTLAKEKEKDEIEYEVLMEKTMQLLEDIKETIFARSLNRLDICEPEKVLFIYMAHLYVQNNDDDIRFGNIEDLYDNCEIPTYIKRELRSHELSLFELGLIENVNEDGMVRSDAFKLTNKAKEEILGELAIHNVGKSEHNLLQHDSLAKKKLIYNPKEDRQVKELSSILNEKRFKEVQSRLKESGMRQGFCCLFYGSPGTGKTETVYQLARQTGRNIMQVDVDKVKSCWVGESEKNIKALFDRYRNICKNAKMAPILLFNEADAVLGTRMEGVSRAVDKMENSIQNIILQEMEKLDGIMIATTNLTSNLDKAFERRFLYKIKFEKPSLEARTEIWLSMMKGLKKKEAKMIASKYDLSGGEIENVVRRQTVQYILDGNEKIDMDALEESCRLERLSETKYSKIGF